MSDLVNTSHVEVFYRYEAFKTVNTDSPAGGPNYFGFINIAGQYYIMRETIAGNVSTFDYYVKIASGGVYATDWAGRVGLTYARFDVAFALLG